jgi:hypothetical protein
LQITNDGNVGILVTPPAWATFKALNIGGSSVSANGTSAIILSRNWYFEGGERYFGNDSAQRLELVLNRFVFQTAATNSSGAGAAVTWNTQMTLFETGKLTLGSGGDAEGALQVAVAGLDDQLVLGSAATNRDIAMDMYSGTTRANVLRYQSAVRLMIGASANIGYVDILPGNTQVLRVRSTGLVTLGAESTTDGRLQIRGSGVADAITTYGVILDRGTKIAWTDTGNSSTGEFIYSQQSSPYGVTIHSGGNNAISCPNTSHVYINYEAGTCSIGSTSFSTSYKLYVTGQIYATSDITAYSDKRKKENITTIDNALDKVSALRGVFYNRIDDESKKRNLGVIAQEVLEIVPEAVSYAPDTDEYGVRYGNMVGLLIEAIKEQQTQIESQKTEIEELKDLVKQLINR